MKSGYDFRSIPNVQDRIGQFLSELAAPLFSQEERAELVSKFHDIAKDCLRSHDFENWKSELCFGGMPLEFAVTIDDAANTSLQYYADPLCGPSTVSKATHWMESLASVYAPSTQLASDLITRRCKRHLNDTGRSARTYFFHGLRFLPGQNCVYRLYFNTMWKERADTIDIFSDFLKPDDLAALTLPSIEPMPLLGVGYEICEAGLDKIKLYVLADSDPPDRLITIAGDLLGARATELETLARMVWQYKGANWRMQRMLTTIGIMPETSCLEIKLPFPCLVWEWSSFGLLEPMIDRILDKWGFPELLKSRFGGAAEDLPPWRFIPNHFSLGVSSTNESLSVYFQPAKPTEVRAPLRTDSLPNLREHGFPSYPADTPAGRAHIFRAMFDTLLRAEA